MPQYIGALTLVLLMGLVLGRVLLLKRLGIAALTFGKTHPSDFLLLPFVMFYFYTIFAAAFGLPWLSRQQLFSAGWIAWVGTAVCGLSLGLFGWSLVSFGRSFRVGIDAEHPDQLVTGGAFGFSRNPIYVAFAGILLGQFLIFSNWILLVYLLAGLALLHRQVLREETFLRRHYGQAYAAYCERVRRYV